MFAFMGCVDVVIPKVSCCIVPVKSFFFVCVKLGHVMCFVIEEVTGNSCREVEMNVAVCRFGMGLMKVKNDR